MSDTSEIGLSSVLAVLAFSDFIFVSVGGNRGGGTWTREGGLSLGRRVVVIGRRGERVGGSLIFLSPG